MANPFLIESKPIDMSGLQMAASQYGQQRRASEQQQQQQQQQQALGDQASQLFESGTPQEIAEFSIKNPNFGKLISQQIGFKNDATQANMKKGMQDIILNPANTEQILNERVKMVQAEGGDPSDTFSELAKYQEDPTSYISGIRKSYAVMDPQGSMALEKAENAGKPTAMTAYQQATIEGKKVDQELRRFEADNKRDENKLKRETDVLKQDELKAKINDRKVKAEKAAQTQIEATTRVYQQGNDVLELIGSIRNHPGLSSAVGAKGVSSLFGAFEEPIAGTEASGAKSLIDTLEAKNFLTAVGEFKSAGGVGALSDAEGKKLGAAISSLNRAQSETDFNKSLNTIEGLIKKQIIAAKRQAKKQGFTLNSQQQPDRAVTQQSPQQQNQAPQYGSQYGAPQQQQDNFSNLWGG